MKHIMKFSTASQYQEWKAANSGFSPYFCCCVDTGAKYYQEFINNNGHGYIDLGLPSGTLWATMNLGAASTSDPGSYFAWGETSTKSSYNLETYTFYSQEDDEPTKYNTSDGKTRLELSDDAAHVLWGGSWHIPTSDQLKELYWYLSLEGESITGDETTLICGELVLVVGGAMVNDSIPENATDQILLLSSDLSNEDTSLFRLFSANDGVPTQGGAPRFYGFNIRPVLGGENFVFTVPDSGGTPEPAR
jgi:hypothetical protein